MKGIPNVLWYCSDQQRFDTIGALGNPHINTPRIDRFLERSVAFTHAFCQSPICSPSRASFLTGVYPSVIGVNGNGYEFFPKNYEDRLISHQLAQAGYDCGLVGKLHLSGAARGRENRVNDGYRYFQYSHSQKGPDQKGHDYARWIHDRGANPHELMAPESPQTYRFGSKVKSFSGLYEPSLDQDNIPPALHQTFWCTEKGIDFIQQPRPPGQPWLLSVNPFDPHPPFDPPFEYYRRYDPDTLPGAHFEKTDLVHQSMLTNAGIDFQSEPHPPEHWEHQKVQASYYAMIEQIDHEFGRLLDALDTSGQRDNTIVIFASDHGEALCDHGLVGKGCRFLEGMVRVPLIISWPGHYQEGVVTDTLVELTDLAPTLYDAVQLPVPSFIQGKSLHTMLRGEAFEYHRDFVRCEFFGAIDYPDQTHATMYRDHKWKLNCYHSKDICELYNLETDPWEHNDLSQNPDFLELKSQLLSKSLDAMVYALPSSPARVMPF